MSTRPQARVPHPHRLMAAAAIAAATMFVGLPLQAQSPAASAPPPAPVAGNAAHGRSLFMTYYCYSCHGTDGQGGAGARLKAPDLPPFDAVRIYVRKPAGRMPAYRSSALADAQLADIYAYLKSIPAPASAKSISLLNQ